MSKRIGGYRKAEGLCDKVTGEAGQVRGGIPCGAPLGGEAYRVLGKLFCNAGEAL
jgi:hypothetical protein